MTGNLPTCSSEISFTFAVVISCRIDSEGTYSRKQIIEDDLYWKAETGSDKLNVEEKKAAKRDRRSWYINSWCMHDHDLYHMWQSYTNVCHAVAVQIRVANLVAICDAKEVIEFRHYQLSVSTVKYYNQKEGEFIDSFPTGFNPFVSKDHHFGLDNEIRILKWGPFVQKKMNRRQMDSSCP